MPNQRKSDTMSWDANQVRQAQQSAEAPRKTKKKKKKNRGQGVLIYVV